LTTYGVSCYTTLAEEAQRIRLWLCSLLRRCMLTTDETRARVIAEIKRLTPIFMGTDQADLIKLALEAGGPLRMNLLPIIVSNVVASQAALSIHLGNLVSLLGIEVEAPQHITKKAMEFLDKLKEDTNEEEPHVN